MSTELRVASLDAAHTPRSTVAVAPSGLEELIAATPTSFLQPYCFFVSWQGVLTLAHRRADACQLYISGFPKALIDLKGALVANCAALPPESPGSKWPKTTLGALRDGVRLTPEQLQQLNAICKEESAAFVETDRVKDALRVWIDRVSVVLYECRSLERTLVAHEVLMSSDVDPRPVDSAEQERVHGIVAEAFHEDYWYAASRDGNRTTHYRGNHIGATLVHKLAAFAAAGPDALSAPLLPALVRKFRDRVDVELPGLYDWFADSSLHVTLRSLKD